MNNTTTFISVAEIQKVLDVSEAKAYRIVRSLNSELKKNGFWVLQGKVSRQYFNERFYGVQSKEGGEGNGIRSCFQMLVFGQPLDCVLCWYLRIWCLAFFH